MKIKYFKQNGWFYCKINGLSTGSYNDASNNVAVTPDECPIKRLKK